MTICNELNCKKNAHFGFKGEKPKYCKEHSTDEMINVVDKKCLCGKARPSFGLVNDKAPTCCTSCRTPEMIDIKHKKCLCNKAIPIFGIKDSKNPTCCKECKTPEMIDIINKICLCGKVRPSFGLETDKKATCCKECKTSEMINIKDNKCIKCNIKRPNFGLKGDRATHCKNCKTSEMIDVKNKKCVCGSAQPNFGLEGGKATHCKDCKDNDMINLNSKKCLTELCNTQINNPSYDGYCAYCYGNLFPDSPIVRNFKTKERLVVDYIRFQYPDLSWKFDKIIENGCSKRRPDIYLDLGYQVVIVEVDENQHQSYDCSCENKRLMELSQDINHRPLVFIRFNPDKYFDQDNKNIPSCFSITKKTGALKVNNKKKWNERLSNLKTQIDYWMNNNTDKTIEIIQLYYDENF